MAANRPTGRLPAKPGAALKALRAQRGLTLAQVAEKTGFTVSTLSKVERDKIGLTFDKLVRLSEGLEIDIAQLFGAAGGEALRAESATRRSISRAGEGRSIEMPRGNYLYLAGDLLNKRIVPIIGEVLARDLKDYGELMRHSGEEFVYVVEGTLELHTEVYTPARLEKGDSVYFDSAMGHAYIAVGDKPCRILSICATAERELIKSHELIASAAAKPVDRKPPAKAKRGRPKAR
ncbi:MAG: XRE family transcriptional regulator [Gammaproteobacteria bacterium]